MPRRPPQPPTPQVSLDELQRLEGLLDVPWLCRPFRGSATGGCAPCTEPLCSQCTAPWPAEDNGSASIAGADDCGHFSATCLTGLDYDHPNGGDVDDEPFFGAPIEFVIRRLRTPENIASENSWLGEHKDRLRAAAHTIRALRWALRSEDDDFLGHLGGLAAAYLRDPLRRRYQGKRLPLDGICIGLADNNESLPLEAKVDDRTRPEQLLEIRNRLQEDLLRLRDDMPPREAAMEIAADIALELADATSTSVLFDEQQQGQFLRFWDEIEAAEWNIPAHSELIKILYKVTLRHLTESLLELGRFHDGNTDRVTSLLVRALNAVGVQGARHWFDFERRREERGVDDGERGEPEG